MHHTIDFAPALSDIDCAAHRPAITMFGNTPVKLSRSAVVELARIKAFLGADAEQAFPVFTFNDPKDTVDSTHTELSLVGLRCARGSAVEHRISDQLGNLAPGEGDMIEQPERVYDATSIKALMYSLPAAARSRA